MPNSLRINEIDWHYEIDGDGECLLFIHGWGVDKKIWRQQLKYFSLEYKVLAVDLPGHGNSSWHKVSLMRMATDVRFLLNKIGISEVTIIGSSLGGLLALRFYEQFPLMVRKLVLVGTLPKFARSEDFPSGMDVERMKKIRQQIITDYPAVMHIFFRSLFTKEERQTRRYHWIKRFRRDTIFPPQPTLMEYLDILEKEDLREVLRQIECPLQFITGSGDYICNQDVLSSVRELVPGARFDIFDGCGHFPFLSRPYEFNDVLSSFLKGKIWEQK